MSLRDLSLDRGRLLNVSARRLNQLTAFAENDPEWTDPIGDDASTDLLTPASSSLGVETRTAVIKDELDNNSSSASGSNHPKLDSSGRSSDWDESNHTSQSLKTNVLLRSSLSHKGGFSITQPTACTMPPPPVKPSHWRQRC